jgi:hypothetical protein
VDSPPHENDLLPEQDQAEESFKQIAQALKSAA